MNKYLSYLLFAAFSAVGISSCHSDEPPTPEEKDPHTYVDLGLSVLWADCNIGAEKASDFGNYYAWGETETKEEYTYANYKFADEDGNHSGPGDISGTENDVAHVLWGFGWRMPSCEEIQELINKCEWIWTAKDNMGGYNVTGPNGNSIFLPAAGYKTKTALNYEGENGSYWTVTPKEGSDTDAYYLVFGSKYRFDYSWRYYGQTVRAVKPKSFI